MSAEIELTEEERKEAKRKLFEQLAALLDPLVEDGEEEDG